MHTGGAEARALEQHHQRNLVADCELGDAIPLGIAARGDGPCQRREVLRAYQHRHAVDLAGPGDDCVGRDLAANQCAEFAERAGIEKSLDPRAGVELALTVVPVEPLGAAHAARTSTATVEIVERFVPVLGLCHCSVLPRMGSVRMNQLTYWIAYCKVTHMASARRLTIDENLNSARNDDGLSQRR